MICAETFLSSALLTSWIFTGKRTSSVLQSGDQRPALCSSLLPPGRFFVAGNGIDLELGGLFPTHRREPLSEPNHQAAALFMAKQSKSAIKPKNQPESLKGWKQIAEFLGEPISVVKRWRSEGMPVFEQGRFVTTSPEQLNVWLGRESGKPVHVVTPETDLAAELKRGVAFLRAKKKTVHK